MFEPQTQYHAFFEHNPQPMWIYDQDSLVILAVNEAAIRHYGYTREEFLTLSIADVRPAEDVPRLEMRMAQLRSGLHFSGIWRHRKKDGSIIHVSITSHSLIFHDRPARLVLLSDVTEWIRAETVLKIRARQQAAVAELAQLALREPGLTALFQAAVETVARTLDVEHSIILEINPEQSRITLRAAVGPMLSTRAVEAFTTATLMQSADHAAAQPPAPPVDTGAESASSVSVVVPGKTAPFGVIGAYTTHQRDFTSDDILFLQSVASSLAAAIARSQAEAEIVRQKGVFQQVFDHVPVMMAVYDDNFTVMMVNHEWQRRLGWSAAELRGRDMLADLCPDLRERAEMQAHLSAANPTWREFRIRVRAGDYRETLWAGLRLSDGRLLGIGQDITERKQLAAQFLQAQKMEGVGRMAGGIAHDFNNLLTAIVGYVELALAELPPDSLLRSDLHEIQLAAERATGLTRQLLAFSRRQFFETRVLNLNELVVDLDKMLRRLLGEDVELVTLPAANLWSVKADAGQIEQVIVNLAVNARDAMEEGGKLTLETANLPIETTVSRPDSELAPGDYVLLRVVDTGCGMDAATLAQAFEPFFTTKVRGKGTGLGLATCYGIIKQHGGTVTIVSRVGHGTTVEVILPRVEDSRAEEKPVVAGDEVPRGNETILLVEDEPAVRALAARVLQTHGYQLVEASNGDDALRLLLEQPALQIDLLLTDVVMPQMGGRVLADRLRARQPGIKVIFMSGYADTTVIRHRQFEPGIAFLQKPFAPLALVRKVREVLDAD